MSVFLLDCHGLRELTRRATYHPAWGDCDALSEAGYCYAQGIGCKKDLKKSAKFYRMAESKGMSMVGNSWWVLLPSDMSTSLPPASFHSSHSQPTTPGLSH